MQKNQSKFIKKNNNINLAISEVEAPEARIIARSIRSLKRVFYSLKHPFYRNLWVGGWFSNVGSWIQSVAIGWIVYELTRSSVSLGIVNFAATIPVFFLSFYAGVLADRFSKKWIVFAGNFFPMIFAFILGFLAQTNKIDFISIVSIAFLTGIATAFAFPAWQALISEVVPRKDLMNAIALNSVQFHLSRLVGPALAGFLVGELGTSWAFYINGISFLAVLLALMTVRTEQRGRVKSRRKWFHEAVDGFRYIKENGGLFWYMANVGLIGVFGIAYVSSLMPLFVGDILKAQAKEYGVVLGANGLGGLLGALFVAWVAGRAHPVSIVRFSIPLSGIFVLLFSLSKNLSLSLILYFFAGFFFLATNSTLNTLVQSRVDDLYRGRVMSVFVWLFMGLGPFGSILGGFLGKIIGVSNAIALAGALTAVLGVIFLSLAGRRDLKSFKR